MHLTILQENLKRGLNLVGHASSKNINLPILNNVLIKADKGNIELIATNLEIGITYNLRGKIENSGQLTVDSKLITEYVSLLSGGEKVELSGDENGMEIICGSYQTKMRGESSKDFPLIPTLNKDGYFSCQANDFRQSLNSVIFATASNENRLELSGVLFDFIGDKLNLVATDSYRLAEKQVSISSFNKSDSRVIVPAKTAQELLRILNGFSGDDLDTSNDLKIYLSENQILFAIDSVELVSRLINGQYPDYKQIIPAKSQTEALVDCGELIRAVKAAALFSRAGVNDISINFSNKKIIISSSSGASGESLIEIEAEVNGEDNNILVNYRYIIDGLNNIKTGLVGISILNSNSPCVFKSHKNDDYLYIVMPIKQ